MKPLLLSLILSLSASAADIAALVIGSDVGVKALAAQAMRYALPVN